MSRVPRDDVVRLYDEGVHGFQAAAEGLRSEEWTRPACGDWTAVELARHVLAVAGWYHEWLDRAERGDPAPAFGVEDLAQRNAEALAELAHLDGPAAVGRFVARARAYGARLPSSWDLPFGFPRGTVTAGLHAAMAASEWHLHTWDLAHARGFGHRPSDPATLCGNRGVHRGGRGRLPRKSRRCARAPGVPTPALGGDAQALRPGARCGRLTSAPADAAEHVCVAALRARSLEGAVGLGDAATPDGLAVAGRAPLHATAGVMHPADRSTAVAALLWFVAMPRPEFLAPRDAGIGPAIDDDGVGQAADPLGHLAATVRTNGHDSPLFNRAADHLRPV